MKPLRILIASESFYPVVSGVAVMTERLAHYLAKQGHTITVITPSRSHRMYQERRRGYTIQRVPSWPNPFRKTQRITFFPTRSVKKILSKVQPDIVHIHDPWLTSIAVAKYCREHAIPVLVTHHFSYDFLRAYVRNLKPLHKGMQIVLEKTLFLPLYNTCDVLTVPTKTMQRGINEIDGLEVTPQIVSNGVSTERFGKPISLDSFREKYQLPANRPLVTCVSRLDPEKNISMHLEALQLLVKQRVPFHALIVGDGSERESLQEQAEELGLHKYVTWIKRIDNQSTELVQLYQASALFCIPSPIETESIVTMEAMAAGLPIVATKAGALPELVKEGVNGYLVLPKHREVWAKKIQLLLEDTKLRTSMGQASRTRIQPRDIHKTLGKFEELYEELLISKENAHPPRRVGKRVQPGYR